MVDLLALYFLTRTESETARNEFHDLQMRDKSNPNETFPEFKARFQSAAIKGNVSKSEWFFYMWEKLYHPLQIETRGLKMNWNGSYDAMVKHLTFIEMERQRSFGKSASRSQTDKKTTITANLSTPRTTSKSSSLGSKPNPTITRQDIGSITRTSSPFIARKVYQDRHTATFAGLEGGRCFTYKELGHFISSCPNKAAIKEIGNKKEDLTKDKDLLESIDIKET